MAARKGLIVPQRGASILKTKWQDSNPAHGMSHDRTEAAVKTIEDTRPTRNAVVRTLVAGANTVHHGLGRVPKGCHVVPTTASVAFAWAFTSANGVDAVVTTVGPTQANAVIEFF